MVFNLPHHPHIVISRWQLQTCSRPGPHSGIILVASLPLWTTAFLPLLDQGGPLTGALTALGPSNLAALRGQPRVASQSL